METIFRKYRSKGEVWQLGWYRPLYWIAEEENGPPFRPCILVCLSLRTGRSQSTMPGTGEPEPAAFRELVTQAARAWRLRPERIEVTDARLAEDLRGLLSTEKISIELRSDLPELRALQEERVRSMRSILPPAALDAPGLTVERMAAFARVAARFFEAAPWRHLDVDDLLVLEAADLPRELRRARILGPVAVLFHPQEPEEEFEDGFDAKAEGFDSEDEEPDWEMESWDDDWPSEEGLWKVSFVPPIALPPEDVELWLDQDLPLAHANAYPLALRSFDGGAERPDARYLRWFEVVLDALASTTEEEMDAGRWEKEVVTSDGPVRLVLSLPDVLEPPYADSLPREDGDEVPEAMRLGFELATEAFGAFGRRQIHLARRAVALWPDCIEGWLVLARRALDLEAARNLYAEAAAAGERLLPGIERREDPFDEEELRAFAPYCWARSGLGRTLWTLGAREEALNHFRWLLAVAPDRKGAWYLAHALLALGRDEEVEDLLARYEDMRPDWLYVRALLTFRREGDSPAAHRQMAAAIQGDRDLAKQLLGDVWLEESEEESPAIPFQEVWTEIPGALEALRTQSAALAAMAKTRKAKKKGGKKKRKRRRR
ncbi:MAG TPA: tetratricopeptide repeat protein [Thermoanaerobaculia bacterium]|nr:tetratricopeptide repeat protein [Thermoanaerobaculia bacterium]